MRRTPKVPQQNKRESLAKATRKLLPKRRAVVHRAERRIAHQALAATVAHEDLELPDEVEPRLRRKRLQGSEKKKKKARAGR